MDGLETNSTTDLSEDTKLLTEEEEPGKIPTEPEVPTEQPEVRAKTKESEEEEETEDSEDSEDSEETEPDEEETLSASKPRPTFAQLKEKFPTIFKEFPALKDMYFREQRFSTIFATVEDAEESYENSVALGNLRESVLSGDSEKLFGAVNESDPQALSKLSERLLPTLFKMSPDAHYKATLPLLENVVRGFFAEGSRRGNEDMANAALHLSEYLFGDLAIAKGEKTLIKTPIQQDDSERKKLAEDRKAFDDERMGSFTINVKSEAFDGLNKLVGGDSKIDPDGVFSKFVRETIRDKIIEGVNKQMEADKAHLAYMNSLWARARQSGYKGDWKSRITTAYLARAKSLVPTIRAGLISEALGSTRVQDGKKSNVVDKVLGRRESGTSGKAPTNGNVTYDAKKIDWSKTSDEDLLNDNVTLKRN